MIITAMVEYKTVIKSRTSRSRTIEINEVMRADSARGPNIVEKITFAIMSLA